MGSNWIGDESYDVEGRWSWPAFFVIVVCFAIVAFVGVWQS